jgi:hypothetical protein
VRDFGLTHFRPATSASSTSPTARNPNPESVIDATTANNEMIPEIDIANQQIQVRASKISLIRQIVVLMLTI